MAVHKLLMDIASASVFLLTWRSSAACLRGSRASLAPQSTRSLSISQSCSCQLLYLKAGRAGESAPPGATPALTEAVCVEWEAGPDLQAGAPGAHVLPQQHVVERDRADDVIQLLDH